MLEELQMETAANVYRGGMGDRNEKYNCWMKI